MGGVLFADVDAAKVVEWVVVLGVGGGLKWFLDYVRSWAGDRRKQAAADEDSAVARYQELLRRVDADRVDCIKDNAKLEAKFDVANHKILLLTIKVERAVGWIRNLEGKLEDNGVAFERYRDDPPAPEPRARSGDTPEPFVPKTPPGGDR